MALTQEKALAAWKQVQHLISVGAYEERSAEHYETNTWPEDGIEETAFNLESGAGQYGRREQRHDLVSGRLDVRKRGVTPCQN